MASIFSKIDRICNSQFKCNDLKNEKLFLNFSFHFMNLHQILNILNKTMIVIIANVFAKLETLKDFVRALSKKPRFRTRSDSQHVKALQMRRKSPCKRFYQVFPSFSGMLIWKISPLVLVEILRVFVSRLTADDQYPIEHCGNMQVPIQMQFSKKPKTFS